jgi:hypothetical protein
MARAGPFWCGRGRDEMARFHEKFHKEHELFSQVQEAMMDMSHMIGFTKVRPNRVLDRPR